METEADFKFKFNFSQKNQNWENAAATFKKKGEKRLLTCKTSSLILKL